MLKSFCKNESFLYNDSMKLALQSQNIDFLKIILLLSCIWKNILNYLWIFLWL